MDDQIEDYDPDTVDTQEGYDRESLDIIEGEDRQDLGPVFVDIGKGDQGDGEFIMQVIIYLKPQADRGEVERALQKTCLSVFGRDSSGFDTVFYDQEKIKFTMGSKLHDLDNFEITIQWPKSKLYPKGKLENIFVPELKKELEDS